MIPGRIFKDYIENSMWRIVTSNWTEIHQNLQCAVQWSKSSRVYTNNNGHTCGSDNWETLHNSSFGVYYVQVDANIQDSAFFTKDQE